MMVEVNTVKGETAVKIGGVEIVLAATMEGLAQVSAATGRPTMPELFNRLLGGEIDTVLVAIRLLTRRGTDADGRPLNRRVAADEAVKAYRIVDFAALRVGLEALLEPLIGEPGEVPAKNA